MTPGSPEDIVRSVLLRGRRRLRIQGCADAALAGLAVAAASTVLGAGWVISILLGAATLIGAGVATWRRWTTARVADEIEAAYPGFENMLVTAREALEGRPIHPVLFGELWAQTTVRLRDLPRGPSYSMILRFGRVLVAFVAVAILMAYPPTPAPSEEELQSEGRRGLAAEPLRLRVLVTPPPYTRQPVARFENPSVVEALEGSTVRFEAPATTSRLWLVEPGGESRAFAGSRSGLALEVVATDSRVFLIQREAGRSSAADRLLQLRVRRDERPGVTIDQPGRDLLFPAPTGEVPIVVTARDDLNVAAISLRYTRIAGSGETFVFQEGELPLRLSPGVGSTTREGRGHLQLDALQLEDGDTLVYRALARDDKPGADPASSESYLVEIGRRGEAPAGGFAVEENRDRQGLSQQMLIAKTERLHAARARLPSEEALAQSRLLAVEQRMVRAEFVFLTGGEVVDEVEEAEHAHELAAGRFENAGQIELLTAIREMSRAEARLNEGDTGQALVFERAALAALQRAFDRRRYFLRTLPERTRIDLSRRLSGDLSAARPTPAEREGRAPDVTAQRLRDAIAEVRAAIGDGSGLDASLAARMITLDSSSAVLQQATVRVASDATLQEKMEAARRIETYLAALLQRHLLPGAAWKIQRDPLTGMLATGARR